MEAILDDKVYNPLGFYLDKNGKVYKRSIDYGFNSQECYIEVVPEKDINGYCFIKDSKSKTAIKTVSGDVNGYYVHRMVVFTFGDKNGVSYNSKGVKSVIDHIDMDHSNNAVSNLEIVSDGINLFRAYWKTKSKSCLSRLTDFYTELDELGKFVFKKEIEQEMQRHPDWY